LNYMNVKLWRPVGLIFLYLMMVVPFVLAEDPVTPHIDPGPVKLDPPDFTVKIRPELLGRHPRIFFDAAELQAIQQKIKNPKLAPMVGWFLHDADLTMSWPVPPTAMAAAAHDDMRHSGLYLQQLAFAYVITGDARYFTAERNLIKNILNWSSWEDFDLGSAHICFGLSMAYDWLYDDFTPGERQAIEAALLKHGRLLLQDPATHKSHWWNTAYFQNHCWICHTAISVTAMALYDLHPEEMQTWLDDSRTRFQPTYKNLGLDGGYHEGAGYARYGTEWMLYYVDSLRHVSGQNLFDMPFLKQVGTYFCNTIMPDWANLANFGDCPPTAWGFPIEDSTLVKLAAEYHDGHLIWLRDHNRPFYEKNPIRNLFESPFALIWVDPSIDPKPLDDLPLIGLYPDLGLVVSRNSWKDDASVIALHCGAPGGQHLVEATPTIKHANANNGHTHPDANSFLFWADHGWRIGLPGAYTYIKATHNENTWLVGGQGQRGDNLIWFEQKSYMGKSDQAHLVTVETTPQADYVVGEAAPAYPEECGLTQFTRHLLFVKGTSPYIVAFDQLAAQKPQTWASYLHTYTAITTVDDSGFEVAASSPQSPGAPGLPNSPTFGSLFAPGKLDLTAQPLFVLREHTTKPTAHGFELRAMPQGVSESTWLITVVGVAKQEVHLVKPGPEPEISVGTDHIAWNEQGEVVLNDNRITGNLMPAPIQPATPSTGMTPANVPDAGPPLSPDGSVAQNELISNPSFESGLDGWQAQKLEGTQATFEVKEIENGRHALCVTVPQAAEKRYYIQLVHPIYSLLSANTSYTLSFRARSQPAAPIVVIMHTGGSAPQELLRADPVDLTADWKDYTYTITPQQNSEANYLTISGLAAQPGEYWFTDVSLQAGTGTGNPTLQPSPAAAPHVEKTPGSIPGAETYIYRDGTPDPMRLFVFKPADWKQTDHRPALIFFFGGGWTHGSPTAGADFARMAAPLGLVGIAPDYRTKTRFGTSPLESVADSRAAFRWIQDHAVELGIDPARIIVGGHSAGGHLALWTAIDKTPPGSDPNEAPKAKPAALFLLAPVSDTSPTGYTPYRFGANALALSPVHQLDGKMPPTLLIHADTDEVVPYRESVALNAALLQNGAVCEFVTVPHGTHSFPWQTPGWNTHVLMDRLVAFLKKNGILADSSSGKQLVR
jgi:acetyl esterase